MSIHLKLKSKHKRTWIKALRSGDYQQGRGDLMDHSGKCCGLGVAIDVLLDDWWVRIPEIINGGNPGWCPQSMLNRDDDPLTTIASEWFRKPRWVDQLDFWYSVDIFVRDIAEMNDEEELSLAEIADYIEENH